MSKLRLTGTQKLQVALSGAATASRVTVSYMDFSATGVTGGTVLTVTNGASPVDICGAPAASTTRQIDHIKLVAKAAMTPTFSVNDGTAEEWDTVTLASGDVYEWGSDGAVVRDSGGNTKRVIGGAVAATTIAASGLATFNAGATVASGQTLTLTGATVAGAPTWSSSQAITISTATQASITTMANLVTVGALNSGSITSGFGSIDIGADSLTAGAISGTGLTIGTGVATSLATIDGDGAAAAGGALVLKKDSVMTGIIGHQSYIAGGASTSSNLAIYADTGLSVVTYANGALVTTVSSTGLAVTGTGVISGGFGCNGKTAQTAYASGGVLANVVAALVANGILSN